MGQCAARPAAGWVNGIVEHERRLDMYRHEATEQEIADYLAGFRRSRGGSLYLRKDGRVYSVFRGRMFKRGRPRRYGWQWCIKNTETGELEYSRDCFEDVLSCARDLYELFNC
jgi:hypothetical protein